VFGFIFLFAVLTFFAWAAFAVEVFIVEFEFIALVTNTTILVCRRGELRDLAEANTFDFRPAIRYAVIFAESASSVRSTFATGICNLGLDEAARATWPAPALACLASTSGADGRNLGTAVNRHTESLLIESARLKTASILAERRVLQ
jgi:hypothetical protein